MRDAKWWTPVKPICHEWWDKTGMDKFGFVGGEGVFGGDNGI